MQQRLEVSEALYLFRAGSIRNATTTTREQDGNQLDTKHMLYHSTTWASPIPVCTAPHCNELRLNRLSFPVRLCNLGAVRLSGGSTVTFEGETTFINNSATSDGGE